MRAGGLREQRQGEELVAYVFGELLARRDGAEAVGGNHQLYLGENLEYYGDADGDAEAAVAKVSARYADGADQTFEGKGNDRFIGNGEQYVLVDVHVCASHPFLTVLIDEQHIDGDAYPTAHARKLRAVAQTVDGEVADGAAGGGGAAALKRPRAARLRAARAVLGVFDGVVISKSLAAAAGAIAAASVALARARAGGHRSAGGIGQHRHDAAHGDNLIVELLLLHTGVVNILYLNTDSFVQTMTGVSVDAAGGHLGVAILVAEKRHIHTSLFLGGGDHFAPHCILCRAAKGVR